MKKIESINLQKSILLFINQLKETLAASIEYSDNISAEFNALYSEINEDIELLAENPADLSEKLTDLIHIPSRSEINIDSRINGYNSLITEQLGAVVLAEKYANEVKNKFYLNDFIITSLISAQASSVINAEFSTQPDAVLYADIITNNFDDFTAWHDANYVILDIIDTGENYSNLQEVVAYTAGYLIETSFTLKKEATIIIDRNYSIINLCHKLYGDVDEFLDFFISTNNFSGSDLIELKAGMEIVYYV